MHKWARKRLVLLRKVLLGNSVALASFPRSGNTWLSKLVEELSGRRAGSIYRDVVFSRPACGIVVKTHKLDGQRYNRFVHLLRNPFDCIPSWYDYRLHYFPTKAGDWESHVALQSRKWREHTEFWMKLDKPHTVIRYEDLVARPAVELMAIADFLGLPVTEEKVAQAVEACRIDKLRQVSASRGEDAANFFRKGEIGLGRARFSDAQISQVEAEVGEMMKRFGYESSAQPAWRDFEPKPRPIRAAAQPR